MPKITKEEKAKAVLALGGKKPPTKSNPYMRNVDAILAIGGKRKKK